RGALAPAADHASLAAASASAAASPALSSTSTRAAASPLPPWRVATAWTTAAAPRPPTQPLEELYTHGRYSDVRLCAFGRVFKLHRAMLYKSPFFARLLLAQEAQAGRDGRRGGRDRKRPRIAASPSSRRPDADAVHHHGRGHAVSACDADLADEVDELDHDDVDVDDDDDDDDERVILLDFSQDPRLVAGAFELALRHLYGLPLTAPLTSRSALPLLAAACFLEMADLMEHCTTIVLDAVYVEGPHLAAAIDTLLPPAPFARPGTRRIGHGDSRGPADLDDVAQPYETLMRITYERIQYALLSCLVQFANLRLMRQSGGRAHHERLAASQMSQASQASQTSQTGLPAGSIEDFIVQLPPKWMRHVLGHDALIVASEFERYRVVHDVVRTLRERAITPFAPMALCKTERPPDALGLAPPSPPPAMASLSMATATAAAALPTRGTFASLRETHSRDAMVMMDPASHRCSDATQTPHQCSDATQTPNPPDDAARHGRDGRHEGGADADGASDGADERHETQSMPATPASARGIGTLLGAFWSTMRHAIDDNAALLRSPSAATPPSALGKRKSRAARTHDDVSTGTQTPAYNSAMTTPVNPPRALRRTHSAMGDGGDRGGDRNGGGGSGSGARIHVFAKNPRHSLSGPLGPPLMARYDAAGGDSPRSRRRHPAQAHARQTSHGSSTSLSASGRGWLDAGPWGDDGAAAAHAASPSFDPPSLYPATVHYTYMPFWQLEHVRLDGTMPARDLMEHWWLQSLLTFGSAPVPRRWPPARPADDVDADDAGADAVTLPPFRFSLRFQRVGERLAQQDVLHSDMVTCAGIQYRVVLRRTAAPATATDVDAGPTAAPSYFVNALLQRNRLPAKSLHQDPAAAAADGGAVRELPLETIGYRIYAFNRHAFHHDPLFWQRYHVPVADVGWTGDGAIDPFAVAADTSDLALAVVVRFPAPAMAAAAPSAPPTPSPPMSATPTSQPTAPTGASARPVTTCRPSQADAPSQAVAARQAPQASKPNKAKATQPSRLPTPNARPPPVPEAVATVVDGSDDEDADAVDDSDSEASDAGRSATATTSTD
ncbi:hypothetical protein CXG81DRAFT_25751, partial [Caulochytrium protostelioides]